MRYKTDICCSCGTRVRSKELEPSVADILKPDGTITYTDFWFCSQDCFKEEVDGYLEKKYKWDAEPDDDPGVAAAKRAFDEPPAYLPDVSEWTREEFRNWAMQRPEYAAWQEQIRYWRQLKALAIWQAEDKLRKHLEAEWIHQSDERTAKLLAELDEDDETPAEAERWRKKVEQFESEQAEEEKWKPKPFKL